MGGKKFGMTIETKGKRSFGRDIPGFWRDVPELPEKFEKKKFAFNFWSGGVRARFCVRFQAVKVPIFGGFPVENPTNKATTSKPNLRGISLCEYGSEVFRVRLRRLSEYGSDAYLVERPTRETQAEQYSDTVLFGPYMQFFRCCCAVFCLLQRSFWDK